MHGPQALTLTTPDGTALHVSDWHADRAVAGRRGVLILHGIGEHSGRYAHVAHFFAECGYDVRSYDHRGHGRSAGSRGDTPDEEAIVRDAAFVLQEFAGHFDTPPLLLGHSMGGLFAAWLATRFAAARSTSISGLILSSPALSISLSAPQKILLRTLNALAPGLAIKNGLQTRYLSHDPAVVEAYCNDPLVHPKITARLLRSMLAGVDFAQTHANALAVPTLLLVAGEDKLVDARGSDAFFERLRPGVGTIHHYPGFYHEIFNETGAAQVFADVRAWLGDQALMPEAQAQSA